MLVQQGKKKLWDYRTFLVSFSQCSGKCFKNFNSNNYSWWGFFIHCRNDDLRSIHLRLIHGPIYLVHDSNALELFLFKVSCVQVAPALDMSLLYWLCSRSAFAPSLLQLWCAPAQLCTPVLLLRVCSCAGCAQLLHQKWSFSGCGQALSTRLCSFSRRYCVPCVLLPWTCSVKWLCSSSGYSGVLFDWCNRLTVSFSGPLADVAHR